jgi:Leucine-rich repeat (LRR) protein
VQPTVRAVCREWRAVFDSGVAHMSAVAPWPILSSPAPPLPLDLPNLVSCELAAVTLPSLECLLGCLAESSPWLSSLCVSKAAFTTLPRPLTALTSLVSLTVNFTALAVLPCPLGLRALTELDASHNALVALPAQLATDVPGLRRLNLTGNVLTELPNLPTGARGFFYRE